MNRISSSIPVLLLLFLLLGACSDNSTDPDTTNTMSALTDHAEWRAVDVSATREGNTITLRGTDQSAPPVSITLIIRNISEPGEASLSNGVNHALYTPGTDTLITFGTGDGSITIQEIDDKHIAGFFGFVARDTTSNLLSVEITNGTFDIEFGE